MTRRLFLKRAGKAVGVVVFLPAARAIGKLAPVGNAYYEHTIVAMGTTARVGVYAASEELANHAISAAFDELKRIESLLTIFDRSSEISRINAAAGQNAIAVSNDTTAILTAAQRYSEQTTEAFDITVEPLMRLWGFRNDSNELVRLPSHEEIETTRKVIGIDQLAIDGNSATLRSAGAKLDLGGIAVGFALDRMVATLKSNNIEDAFIDISGDMFAVGAPEGKRAWDVAIPDPGDTTKIIYKTQITNEALATSGNYMSFVTYQAQKFGHIMDPREGRSAHRVLSATAVAKSGMDADALSTASFVTGEPYPDSKFVLVGVDGKVRIR